MGRPNKKELVDAIKYHDMLYWKLHDPKITDEEYDQLVEKLKTIDPGHKLVTRVNKSIRNDNGTIKHMRPMLSLDKVYSLTELTKWIKQVSRSELELFKIQPKYDGVSCVIYDKGETYATRGNGFIGEDITDKKSIISHIGYERTNIPTYGELVIPLSTFGKFKTIRRDNGEMYKTPRNATAGILNTKDLTYIKKEFKRYKLSLVFVNYAHFTVQKNLVDLLRDWEAIVKQFICLGYPMDGLVISLADPDYFHKQGYTAHHPKGAMAFKFNNARAKSRILSVKWQLGKNTLTPVATLKPVVINGVTIEKVTLHNYKFVKDRDIQIGDFVTIERAGDVIPHVVEIRKSKVRKTAIVESCPSCGCLLSNVGVDLVCTNSNCFDTNLEKLMSAVKRLGIETLGRSTLKQMMVILNVRDLRQILTLTEEDVKSLQGFQDKSASNLISEIKKVLEHSMDYQVLASLEIYDIGLTLCKKILRNTTLSELCEMSEDELRNLPMIGEERSKFLYKGLIDNRDILNDILKLVNVEISKDSIPSKEICFSGKMPEPRSYYEDIAKERGFVPVSRVTKSLSCLVIAPDTKSSKVDAAKKFNIPIVDVETWLK